jgi:hypothetical protein
LPVLALFGLAVFALAVDDSSVADLLFPDLSDPDNPWSALCSVGAELCAAASVEAKVRDPFCPAPTGPPGRASGITAASLEMAFSIGLMNLASVKLRKARPAFMHSRHHLRERCSYHREKRQSACIQVNPHCADIGCD